MRLVKIVHEKAGTASVPESTARVLARTGWKPVDQIDVTTVGDPEPSSVPGGPAGDDQADGKPQRRARRTDSDH